MTLGYYCFVLIDVNKLVDEILSSKVEENKKQIRRRTF